MFAQKSISTVALAVMMACSHSTLAATTDSIFEPVKGFWNKTGYGEFIHIGDGSIEQYQYNQAGCLKTGEFSFEQADTQVKTVIKNPQGELGVLLEGELTPDYYHSAAKLPEQCQQPLPVDDKTDPVTTFEYFWHTFNDHYAFFAARGVDWQAQYQKYRPQVTAATDEATLFNIFSEMLTPLEDGHVNLVSPFERFNVSKPSPYDRSALAFTAEFARSGIRPPVSTTKAIYQNNYLETQQHYMTEQSRKVWPEGEPEPTLVWGKTHDNVGIVVLNNLFIFAENPEQLTSTQLVAATRAKMTEVMADLGNTDSLILDIRNNPGGTDAVAMAVAEFFANRDITIYHKQAVTASGTGHRYVGRLKAHPTPYTKPVYLITSQRTASAAEIFTLAMKSLDNVHLVGEETAGILSKMLSVQLPNGWQLSLSNEVYRDRQGKSFEVSGIEPRHKVHAFTFESLFNNHIESWDHALEQMGKWRTPVLDSNILNRKIPELMAQGRIPGVAAAVVKSDKVVYQNGFGIADMGGRKVTPDTPFYLASVSKGLLGTTVASAVADNRISLSQKVRPLLNFAIDYPLNPDFEPTLAHLVTHTSGIIDTNAVMVCSYYLHEDYTSLYNRVLPQPPCPEGPINPDMPTFLAKYTAAGGQYYQAGNFASQFDFVPGQMSFYSNVATALTGHVLEQKLGESLPALSRRYVFDPLGMADTSWMVETIPKDVSARFAIIPDTGVLISLPEYGSVVYPDGFAISTAADLAKLMIAALNDGQYQGKQALAKTAVTQMLTPQTDKPTTDNGVGYFWRLDGNTFSHDGGDAGVMTTVWADRKNDFAIVLLTNGFSMHPTTPDAFDAIAALLKDYGRSL